MNATSQQESLLGTDELKALGFSRVGKNPHISRKVAFHKISGSIGHHVRIDDYCVITGHIVLGNYTHIAPFCLLSGTGAMITMHNCSGLSSHCSLYTASDDYRGNVLSNPTVPDDYKNVTRGPVTLGIGVIIGSHSVILPNVTIGDAASIGAQSILYKNIPEGAVCVSGVRRMDITGRRNVEKIRAAAKLK